jgi:uncharacterized protein involved in exopolysaccharide biosynthesis
MTYALDQATHGVPWVTVTAIVVAAIGFVGSAIGGILAYRSTRTAAAMTTQTTAQTITLGSMDMRLQATLDGKDALIDDLREERNDLRVERNDFRTQVGELRAAVTALEGSFSAFRDQASAEIRDLQSEVGGLRASDMQWKRWAGVVIAMYATVAEKLHRATSEGSPELPPSPPLT